MRQHSPINEMIKRSETKTLIHKIHIENMKIYNYLLLFLAFYLISLKTYAQTGGITVDLKDITVKEAIRQIKEKTGYKFFFEKNTIDTERKISISVKNGNIEAVIKQLLKPFKVEYSIQNKQILLKPQKEASLNPNQPLIKNKKFKSVTGYVKDFNGVPLPGTTIRLKGTQFGTTSNYDGNFSIKAIEGFTLTFSFVGFETKEVLVTSENEYVVVLDQDISTLDEIVIVSDGYQNIPKERRTGSFGVISPKKLQEVPSINVLDRLEGKISGVNVDVKTNTIRIRGINSYSNGDPLIVIDGFPVPDEDFKFTDKTIEGAATLSNLNPESIESITVLKDAAAFSLWGARAANGVIVIKTKQGKVGEEPSVTFSTALTVGDKPYLDKLKQMSAAQYLDFEKELFDKNFLFDNAPFDPFDPSNFNQGSNLSEAQEWMFRVQRGTATEAERDAVLARLSNQNGVDQIKKYLLRSSESRQYTLSFSGGSEKSTYFISGNYNTDKPAMKGNGAKSYNVTINNTMKLFNNKVDLSTGINYSGGTYTLNNTVQEALSEVSDTRLLPYDLIADENGVGIDKYFKFRPEVIQGFEDLGYKDWTYNYLDELSLSNVVTKSNTIRLNASLSSDITDWLNVSVSGMYLKISQEQEEINEAESYFSRSLINEATTLNFDNSLNYGIPNGARYRLTPSVNESYNLRGQISINKTFNEDHQINFLAAAEIREDERSLYTKTFYGYDEDTNSGQTVNPTTYYTTVYGWDTFIGDSDLSFTKSLNRYLSYASNGSYSYKNRYFISGSVRYDDYNLLGASARDRARPFWSTGFRWALHKESFFESNVFNNLSLRATYGTGGATPLSGAGNVNPRINIGYPDFYTGLSTASISNPGNSRLKWELTKTWNFALDFGLFNNRVNGSVEYYTKKSEDILTSLPFNPTYGFSSLLYNAGTLKGHGVDFNLSANIFENKFKWVTDFTFGYNTNEVTHSNFEATTITDYISSSLIKGRPLGSIYAYKWAGLDSDGQSQIYNEDGDIVDLNVDNSELTKDALAYKGTISAPYFGGLVNTFTYGNFTLSTQMTYQMGHVFRKPSLNNYPSYSGGYFGAIGKNSVIADRWREAGDEATTNVPGISNINFRSLNRYNLADVNVLPADHIRLQQISLSYNVPSQLYSKTGIKGLSLSVFARNLGIIWRKNKEGYDPQYLATSNYSTLLPSRNYTLRLVANF